MNTRVLSDDDLVTIALFASNRFNAAALTDYVIALKFAAATPEQDTATATQEEK